MNSAGQFVLQWKKTEKCDFDNHSKIMTKQYGQRPDVETTIVKDFMEAGLSAVVISDALYIKKHLCVTSGALFITLGTPTSNSGELLTAADISSACNDHFKKCIDLIPSLSGNFSIIAYFHKEKKLIIARDKIGLSPVYYSAERHDNFSSVTIGSGPLSTTAAHGEAKVNMPFLGKYILFRYDDVFGGRETFFQNTYMVGPATIVEMDNNIRHSQYWSFSELNEHSVLNESVIEEKCMAQLLKSTNKSVFQNINLNSEAGKTIISLSSGLDSTTVAAACKKLGNPLPAFTAKYDEDIAVNECGLAKQIADDVCSSWVPFEIKVDEFVEHMKTAYQFHEFPLATSSCLGVDILMEKAIEEGYSRILTGGSGDDLFLGNYPCYLYNLADLFYNQSPQFSKEFQAWIKLHSTSEFPKSSNIFFDFYTSHIDTSEPGLITPKLKLLDDFLTKPDNLALASHVSPQVKINAGDYVKSYVAYGFWYCNKPPGLIPVVEASWRYGVDVLDPFTEEDFLAFSWRIPTESKIKDGYNKVIIRRIMKDILPKTVIERYAKTGFNVPFHKWLVRYNHIDFFADLLQSEEAAEVDLFVDVEQIRQMVINQTLDKISPMFFWQVINAILWLKSLKI